MIIAPKCSVVVIHLQIFEEPNVHQSGMIRRTDMPLTDTISLLNSYSCEIRTGLMHTRTCWTNLLNLYVLTVASVAWKHGAEIWNLDRAYSLARISLSIRFFFIMILQIITKRCDATEALRSMVWFFRLPGKNFDGAKVFQYPAHVPALQFRL